MMKRKSFVKIAIVSLLALTMLLCLCVCSKKADSKTTTAVATTTSETKTEKAETPTTVEKGEEVKAETKAETKVDEPATTAKVEETVTETKTEEPVVAEAEEPVVAKAEETVEEPVKEEKAEAKEVESENKKEDLPVFSSIFTYDGITANIVAYNDHASISIPEGVTANDIASLATALVSAYPVADAVTYTIDGDELLLSYPETASDYIVAAISQLEDDARYVIDSLSSAKTEETVATEITPEETEEDDVYKTDDLTISNDGTVTAIYNYRGLAEAKVVMTDTETTVFYPAEYIYKSDIDSFMALASSVYPEIAKEITYSIAEDGKLVITYPKELLGGTYYKLETLAYANDEVTAYADSILLSLIENLTEEVKAEEVEEVEEVVVETEELPVFSTIFSYKNYKSNIVAYTDHATLTIPEGVTESDIAYIASELVKAYPVASEVEYSIDGDTLLVTYPTVTEEFVALAVTELENDAVALINSLTPVVKAEEKSEEAVETEELPVFSTIFSYKNYKSNIVAYTDHATLTIPEGVTESDIAYIASELVKAYPVASEVEYSIDGDTLLVTYPTVTEEFVALAVTELENDAVALINSLTPVVKAEEVVVIEPEKEEVVALHEEPVKEETVEEIKEEKVVPPAPEAPMAQKESFIKGYSASLTSTPKFNLTQNWPSPFVVGFGLRGEVNFGKLSLGVKASYDLSSYIPALIYGRYNIADFDNGSLYATLGLGANFGIGEGRATGFIVEGALGYEYSLTDSISLFAETLLSWSTNLSFELGANLGAKINF